MSKYIKSKADEPEEITLKDRINELDDKYSYITQSLYLLEAAAANANIDSLIETLNTYLDSCMTIAATAVEDAYATTSVESATNTANIAAKPCQLILGEESCEASFVDMLGTGKVSVAVTEPDEGFNKFAINESELPESLHNATILLDKAPSSDKPVLEWAIVGCPDKAAIAKLQEEVVRYFKAYKDLMGCGDEQFNIILKVIGDGGQVCSEEILDI